MNFDIDRLIANPNSRVVIAGLRPTTGAPGPLTAFMQNDLTMQGGNLYNNPFESAAQDKLNELGQKILPLAREILPSGLVPEGGFQLKSFQQTILSWTGSQKPFFSLQLTFIAIRPTDDVTIPVKKIMSAVLPEDKVGSIFIGAPLSYGPKISLRGAKPSLNATGTLIVQLGKWFRAPGQVTRSAVPTFSQQTISNGKPLYAIVSVTFEPYRMISRAEFERYFVSLG